MLGLFVRRIRLRDGATITDLPLDHPALAQGWWGVEHDGSSVRRWTNGHAVLPLPPPNGGVRLLEIEAGCLTGYLLSDADARKAA